MYGMNTTDEQLLSALPVVRSRRSHPRRGFDEGRPGRSGPPN